MTELVWALLGKPRELDQEMWPATVHDLRSRRLRYQYIPKSQALEISLMGDMAKWRARWHPDRNEWQLVEMVSDTETEAA